MKPTEKTKSRKFPRPWSEKEGLVFHLCLQLCVLERELCAKGPCQRKLIWPAVGSLKPRLGCPSWTKVSGCTLLQPLLICFLPTAVPIHGAPLASDSPPLSHALASTQGHHAIKMACRKSGRVESSTSVPKFLSFLPPGHALTPTSPQWSM